jgi:hypothetical protein
MLLVLCACVVLRGKKSEEEMTQLGRKEIVSLSLVAVAEVG